MLVQLVTTNKCKRALSQNCLWSLKKGIFSEFTDKPQVDLLNQEVVRLVCAKGVSVNHMVPGRQSVHALISGLSGLHQKPEVLMLDLHLRRSAHSHLAMLLFLQRSLH